MKVTNKSYNHHPLEYHVGDIIESVGVEANTGKEVVTHYLVIKVGYKYGLLYIEGNEMATYHHKYHKPFLTNTLEELYDKANDPDDILVDVELVIK